MLPVLELEVEPINMPEYCQLSAADLAAQVVYQMNLFTAMINRVSGLCRIADTT